MRKLAFFTAAIVLLAPASAKARTLISSGALKTTITRAGLGPRIPVRCSRDYLSTVNRTWASATFYDGPGCTRFGSDGITILHLTDRYNGSPGIRGSGRWEPVTAGSDFRCPIISYRHQPQVPENVGADLLKLSCSSLPRVPLTDGASLLDLRIKPSVILYTGDGTGALGGLRRGDSRMMREFGRLRWLSWTSSHAEGVGDDWIDICDPDCAGGCEMLTDTRTK